MNPYLENALDTVRERWIVLLAVVFMVLLLIGYLLFTLNSLLPRWQLRTDLVAQSATAEALYNDRIQAQQGSAVQLSQQIEAAEAEFEQKTNLFLTEAQAALFLDGLYDNAANYDVSIVALQAVPMPQTLPADGQKPVFDVRNFHLVVEGSLAQLTGFASNIEATAVPSIVLQNLLISQGGEGLPDVLSLDLLLYTSPYATGEPAVNLPQSTPSVPLATATPTPNTAVPLTPDVATLLAQLDAAWQQGNWPEVINLVNDILLEEPTNAEMIDKLYAAHVNYGHSLTEMGNPAAAVAQFEQAMALIPGRGEAELGLQSLLPPTPTPTPQVTIHMVQRGDTLYSIARRYGSTVDAVKAANGLANNNIHPGQQLVIP